MVARNLLTFLAASLLVASSEAGSHITGTFPDRLQAIKKRTGAHLAAPMGDLVQMVPRASASADPAMESCVQQCMAPSATLASAAAAASETAAASASAASDDAAASSAAAAPAAAASGSKTITVAPSQGVLRFVPFSTNVQPGETVNFVWGAGPHTTTQSSAANICNKTLAVDEPFSSGMQEAGFQFPVTVADTATPTWFYCSVPNHCVKGMFGLLNPAVTTDTANQAASFISSLADSDDDFASLHSETNSLTSNNTGAANWGSTFDITSVPAEHQRSFAENTMYTRQFFAANPEQLAIHTSDASSTDASSDDASSTVAAADAAATSGTTTVDGSDAAAASASAMSGMDMSMSSGAMSTRAGFGAVGVAVAGVMSMLF